MLTELLYFVAIALLGCVVAGAARLPNDMWLVLAIFPVFIAILLGFVMWLFAFGQLGLWVSVASLVAPVVGYLVTSRLTPRALFMAICAATALGLICAYCAFVAAGLVA